tara:strand:- start:3177 stop:3635 length:459 start_codon:yes stop_codon:yes gene_type:complete
MKYKLVRLLIFGFSILSLVQCSIEKPEFRIHSWEYGKIIAVEDLDSAGLFRMQILNESTRSLFVPLSIAKGCYIPNHFSFYSDSVFLSEISCGTVRTELTEILPKENLQILFYFVPDSVGLGLDSIMTYINFYETINFQRPSRAGFTFIPHK